MTFAPHDHLLSLVVAERGADWAPWAQRLEQGTPGVVVVRQERDEPLSALASRVRARLEDLEAQGREITRGVIVGGGRRDPGTLAARHAVIKTLLAPMVSHGRGTLILDGRGPDRFSMAALATTVRSLVRGAGVQVVATTDPVARVA